VGGGPVRQRADTGRAPLGGAGQGGGEVGRHLALGGPLSGQPAAFLPLAQQACSRAVIVRRLTPAS
jgi:hypothetical protein